MNKKNKIVMGIIIRLLLMFSIPAAMAQDTTPPTISLTEPQAGVTLLQGYGVKLAASASDDIGVAVVEFWVDGVLSASVTSPPFEYMYSIPVSSPPGDRVVTFKAVARDGAGNEAFDEQNFTAQSYPVTVRSVFPATVSTATTDELIINFLYFIKQETFTPADILLMGPDGAVDAVSIECGYCVSVEDPRFPSCVLPSECRVQLARSLADGAYSLTVGPNITSLSGIGMDQDLNGIIGDPYTGTFTINASGPVITVTSPAEGLLTNQSSQTITGNLDESGTLEIIVNGGTVQNASVDPTTFEFAHPILLDQEGVNTVTLRATNLNGDIYAKNIFLVLDSQPPAITVTSPANGSELHQSVVELKGNLDEPVETFTINGVAVPLNASYQFVSYINLGNEGSNTINLQAADAAGNLSSLDLTVVLNDTTPPAITVTQPLQDSVTNLSSQLVTGSVNEQATLTVNNQPVSPTPDGNGNYLFSHDVTGLQPGDNTITIVASDIATNTSTVILNLNYDNGPPPAPVITSHALAPAENLSADTTVSLTGERENGTAILINGVERVPLGSGTWTASMTLTEGSTDLSVVARDEADNLSPASTVKFLVDTTAPVATGVTPSGAVNTAPATIVSAFSETGSGIDINNTVITVMKNGIPAGGSLTLAVSGTELIFTPSVALEEGTYFVRTQLKDLAGNPGEISDSSFTLDLTPPAPPAVDTYPATTGSSTITFTGTKESETAILADGGVVVPLDNSTTWSHQATLIPGSNNISFTARDGAGNESSATLVTVQFDNVPPGPVTLTIAPEGDGTETGLDWSGYDETVNGNDIAEYQIYQASANFTDKTAATSLGAQPAGTKSYQATGLTRGATYYFAVIAVDTQGNESGFTAVAATPVDITPPADVTGLSVTSSLNSLTLNWDSLQGSVVDLAGYRLYVDSVPQPDIAEAATSYDLTALTAATGYALRLTAFDTSGNESAGVTLPASTLLNNPGGVSATPHSGLVALSWLASQPAALVKAYRIYAETADFTSVAALTPKATLSGAALQGSVAGLNNNTPYWFAVTAVNISDGESTDVVTVSATPIAESDGPVMDQFKYETAVLQDNMTINASGRIKVNVTDPSGVNRVEFLLGGVTPTLMGTDVSGVNGDYDLFWNLVDTPDGIYQLTIRAIDNLENVTEQTFTNINVALAPPPPPAVIQPTADVTTNKTQFPVTIQSEEGVQVQLYNNSVAAGAPVLTNSQGQVSVMASLSDGANLLDATAQYPNRGSASVVGVSRTITLDLSIPDAPEGFTAKSLPLGEIRFSWNSAVDARIVGYKLYRSTAPFSDTSDAGVVWVNSATIPGTAYTDMPPDGSYYYRIASINELGSESQLSQQLVAVADSLGPRAITIDYVPSGNFDAVSGRVAPGLVDVSIQFTEPLRNAPYFALVPDGGLPITITMYKNRTDDTLYKGSFVLESTTPPGTAHAVLFAYDIYGNRGDVIDNGATLEIDTYGPEALEIVTTPVHPIQVDPLLPESSRTVQVDLKLTDQSDPSTLPELIPMLDGIPVLGYGSGINLTLDTNPCAPAVECWTGEFLLPVTAGQDSTGNPGVQVLSFSHYAVDDLGNETDKILGRNQFQVYQGDLPPVDIPFGLKAEAQAGGNIQLSWSKVDEASGYLLYRKAYNETQLTQQATINGGSIEQYIDSTTTDGIYEYAIASQRTENGQTSESGLSDPVIVTADGTSPPAPTALQLTLNGAGIVSTWSMDPNEAALPGTTYNLYRLAIPEGAPVDLTGVTPLINAITGTTALDSQPDQNAHTYVVTAVDAAGNESDPSASAYLNFNLLPVSNLAIDLPEEGYPQLTWEHNGTSIQGYDIYQGATKLNGSLVTGKFYTDGAYNEGFPSNGAAVERAYTVKAVDNNSVESIGHDLTLPALSVTLHDPASQQLKRGIMNKLIFRVENNGASSAENIRLLVTVDDNGVPREHQSEPFTIESGNFTLVSVIVGGYELVDPQGLLMERLSLTPQPGESVTIHQTGNIQIGDAILPVTLDTENFTRGASGEARFTILNTSEVETEILTAQANGNTPSSEVRLVLEDLDGNIFSIQPLQQFSGGVITLASGDSVARIPPGGSFTSQPITIAVPEAAPDNIKLRLEIDSYHYHLGAATHASIPGGQSQRDVLLIETPYYGDVTSVTPGEVYSGDPVTITGRALDRISQGPVGSVPVKLVFRVRGFERSATLYTDSSGNFSYQYVPGSNESGLYEVSAIHPDIIDRPVQGTFTVHGAGVTPTEFNINIPTTVPFPLKVKVSSGYQTPLSNLRIAYLDEDQINGIKPADVVINTGGVMSLTENQVGYLYPEITVNSSGDGSVRLRVISDNQPDPLTTVTVNYTAAEGLPTLVSTPSYLNTGLARGESITEILTLENKGFAAVNNLQLQLLDSNEAVLTDPWIYLTSPANPGDLAIGEQYKASITVSPTDTVAEGNHLFLLKATADNMTTPHITPIYVTVTHSGIGTAFFHISDIYTATLDTAGNPIPGVDGAKVKLQNALMLEVEYNKTADAFGTVTFENIPAGRYFYRVSARDHQDVAGSLLVKAGITVSEEVFLVNQLVTVEWSVQEITIQDSYQITLEATFETSVPAALVLFDPLTVNLPVMSAGEIFLGELRLTNHGLIRADNIQATIPSTNDDVLGIEFLGEFPTSLEAGETYILPYRLTALRDFDPGTEGGASGGGCFNITRRVDLLYESTCANGAVYRNSTSFVMNANSGASTCSADFSFTSSGGSVSLSSSFGGSGGTTYSPAPVPSISGIGLPQCLGAGGNCGESKGDGPGD